jgi:response regulator RpfG family c-di-GMP phosphodiesterase
VFTKKSDHFKSLKQRILIVDNEDPILFALKDYFDIQGYEVDCARNLEESKELLNQGVQYAIIIADLYLSGINKKEGLEFLNYVRRISPSTGTILLAGYKAAEIENEARSSGIHIILTRPQSLPAIAKVVHNFMNRDSGLNNA